MINSVTFISDILFANYGAIFIMAFIVFLVSIGLGKIISLSMNEYQSLANLSASDNNFGFNAVYRIIVAPISIVFLSIILYVSGLDFLTKNIWAVSLWYFILQTAFLFVLARWVLVQKLKYFCFHIVSIALSIFIYNSLIIHGVDRLLPDEANLRTDLWLIIAAFIYGLFKHARSDEMRYSKKQNKYIQNRVKYFSKKYESTLNDYQDDVRKVLLAIMIYEDFNRPRLVRLVERVFKSKTQSIMQTRNAKNDIDSIQETADRIRPMYENFLNDHTHHDFDMKLANLFNSHNPNDSSYGWNVLEIYKQI
jgi:cupin superfamily acireductone dioxygenase involved in methionine salvage